MLLLLDLPRPELAVPRPPPTTEPNDGELKEDFCVFPPKALPPLDTFSESRDYLEPARRILLLLILTSLLSLSYVSLGLSTGMVVNLSLVT